MTACRLLAFLLAITGGLRGAAAEQPPAEKEAGPDAREAMETYFAGEKRGGIVLVAMGAAGIGAGAVLATRESDVARGAGYATLGIGAAHAAAGVFVYIASNGRISVFGDQIASEPASFVEAEAERVVDVGKTFTALKIAEGVLIAGGAGAAIYGLSTDRDLLAGIAIGVAAEAAATLVFDVIAARRAGRYLGALRDLKVSPTVDADGSAGASVGLIGRF